MTIKRSAALSLILGLICGGFRLAVWKAAYDPVTQLVTDPALVRTCNLFFCLCLLVIGLVFFIRHPRDTVSPAPYGSQTPARRLLRLAAVVCSLFAGGLLISEQWSARPFPVISLILGLLLLGQGVAELLLTLWTDTERKRYISLLLLPAFSGCFWLVAFYHQFGSYPNRETYLWPILTGIVLAAAWVGYAAFAYERPKGTAFALIALLALPMLLMAAAAPLPLSYRRSLLGQLAWLLAALLSMKFQAPAAEDTSLTEETEHTEEGESPCLKN